METYIKISLIGIISIVANVGSPIGFDVPSSAQFLEGNASTRVPFDTVDIPRRYQQVYDANLFVPIENIGGGFITIIQFRIDGLAEGFGGILPDFQVNLSLTSSSADNMSLIYSDNVGSRNTVVLDRGELRIGGSGGPLFPGPEGFGAVDLDLDTPFFYNPAEGNLLLDIRIFQGIDTTEFDAVDVVGDGLSRVWGGMGETASFSDSLGLVTRFEFEPIPEPGTMALFALGLAGLGLYLHKGRRKT